MDASIPTFELVPDAVESHWDEVRDLCAAYDLVLDPWQETVLKIGLGVRADDTWAASRVGLSVPRQSGKTALFEARELAGLLLYDEKLMMHSAHLVPTALEAFQRLKYYFENFDDLGKQVRRIREGNGDWAIEMMSGSRLLFKARARGSGRGFSADVLLLDEAQILGAREWAAMLPTMSARPNPQAWLAGTPPGPSDDGEAFRRLRESALEGSDSRLAWAEWSIDDPHADVSDVALWRRSNPGMEYGRPVLESVEDEFHSMDAGTFARERLGRWDVAAGSSRAISDADWFASGVEVAPTDGLRVFSVAFNLDGTRLALAGGMKHEHGVHVELIDAAEGDIASGLGALADWLASRWREVAQIVLSGAAGAPVLAQLLKDRQVPNAVVKIATTQEYTTACSVTLDAVRESAAAVAAHAELDEAAPLSFTHLASDGQRQLDDSVAVADKKLRGTSGAWGWSATTDEGDETPIEAVSLAYWMAMTTRRKPYGKKERRAVFL